MKTVLMVAPYFIPRRRVGSLRPFKFAVHLKNLGWNVKILTIGTSSGIYTEREKEALKNIEVIPVTPPFDRTTSSSKSKNKKSSSTSYFDKIGEWVDKHTPADTWIYLFLMRYFQILKKVKDVKPDIIWCTGDPWSGLWLGDKIANRLNVPLVADFRDPWTLASVNLRNRSFFSRSMDKRMEKKIVKNADKLIFTSKAAQETYKSFYSLPDGKTATIYNSFDSTMMNLKEESGWHGNLDQSKLNILFFGQFRWLSPAKPMAEILRVLKKKSTKAFEQIQIHSFGETVPEEKKHIMDAGLESRFTEHEKVLPELSKTVLNKADLLLVSTHQQREHIVPAKLWEYLSVEIPILSITPNSEIGEILKRNGAGVHFHPDEKNEVADFLIQAVQNKNSGKPIVPIHDIKQSGRKDFEASATAGQLANILESLVKDE